MYSEMLCQTNYFYMLQHVEVAGLANQDAKVNIFVYICDLAGGRMQMCINLPPPPLSLSSDIRLMPDQGALLIDLIWNLLSSRIQQLASSAKVVRVGVRQGQCLRMPRQWWTFPSVDLSGMDIGM